MARIVALIVVAALAGAPAVAVAAVQQPTPAQSLLQGAAETQPPEAPATQPQQAPATTTTTTESGSLSGVQVLLIAVAVVALIGGIWIVIARDAKRATAGRTRPVDAELLGGRGGSATRAARRSRKLSAAEKQRRKRGRAH